MAITAFEAINDALEMCSGLGFDMVPGFSTHWPMASEALIRLGHPEAVHAWASQYAARRRHLPRPAAVESIDPGNELSWRSALGEFHRATDWQQLFERELAERPWKHVLVKWWPRLMPGIASGLTHGLIRTMHAVRSIEYSDGLPTALQLQELGMGLAYWASLYVEQPGPASLTGTASLPEILSSIPRLGADTKMQMREKGLFKHMPQVEGWSDAVTRLSSPMDVQAALSELTLSFVQVNLAHPDQFPIPLLHTVSAPAALRLMLPYLPEEMHMPSFIAIWKANAALLTTFAPARPAETARTVPDAEQASLPIDELRERAVEHGDEHAIKFTEACLREYALRPDARYLLAATQLLSKLPRYFRPTRGQH